MMKYLHKTFLPLLSAAVLIISWTGVSFSPGFSESFAACFITALVPELYVRNSFGRMTALAGALLLAAGSYIYAAGDDHLNICVWAALLGGALCGVFQWKRTEPFSELIFRTVLFGSALFTLFCGLFSTALLPLGLGAMLLFGARYTEGARTGLMLAGLFLCSIFLLAPMCFPGGVFV